MKPEHGTRRTIIREWMSLPREKRQTQKQANAFASEAAERHPSGDAVHRTQRISLWLAPRIGRA